MVLAEADRQLRLAHAAQARQDHLGVALGKEAPDLRQFPLAAHEARGGQGTGGGQVQMGQRTDPLPDGAYLGFQEFYQIIQPDGVQLHGIPEDIGNMPDLHGAGVAGDGAGAHAVGGFYVGEDQDDQLIVMCAALAHLDQGVADLIHRSGGSDLDGDIAVFVDQVHAGEILPDGVGVDQLPAIDAVEQSGCGGLRYHMGAGQIVLGCDLHGMDQGAQQLLQSVDQDIPAIKDV